MAGGIGGAGIAIYVIDKLLADNGTVAATMLTKLSPLVGPLWASWPLLALGLVCAVLVRDRWAAAQHARALEVAAQQASSTALAAGVGNVASELTGVRNEVHALRGALQAHADAVDARFVSTDTSLREFVRGELLPVRERVSALEGRGRRRRPEPAA